MIELILSTVVFIASHTIPAYRPWRDALIERMGPITYQIFYATISMGAIAWLIIAFKAAPYIGVWNTQVWMLWVPILVMPFVCIFLTAGASSLNPFSVGRGSEGFDSSHPGIVSVTRHPLMWALTLWAMAHMVPNGNVADLILFGMMLALSLSGPYSLDHKRRAKLGLEQWKKLAHETSNIPFAAILLGRTGLDWRGIGWKRTIAGLILYAIILMFHEAVIGKLALPWQV